MGYREHIPKYAIIDEVERELLQVVAHAVSGERICMFSMPDGSSRYVAEGEWLEGAEHFGTLARNCTLVTSDSPATQKLALFRNLFRGREGVYAHGFPKRDGTIAYAPACANERTRRCPRWNGSNRRMRCAKCSNREFVPLSDATLRKHFKGESSQFRDVCGLYVLTEDCRTWILVADFDKAGWKREVMLYCEACDAHGLSPCIERSRSGNGAHVWLFFEEAVDASLARDLGSILISWAMERSTGMGFSAYDRLFPTQSTISEDGLGNLIALPFQGAAMRKGNSVFVNREFEPYGDQWRFLSGVVRVSEEKVREVVAHFGASPLGPLAVFKGADNNAHKLSAGHASRSKTPDLKAADFSQHVAVVRANMLSVPKTGLSSNACNRVRRLAAFANPEFYKAQAMHKSVYQKSCIVWCGEENEECILLPRGCEERLIDLLVSAGASYDIVDRRNHGQSIRASFTGELRGSQREAADALLHHEYGILSAPTGFGKTVVAAYIIGQLNLRTLVLVPRAELVAQWVEKLNRFVAIEDDRPPLLTKSGRPSKRTRPVIGRIGGGQTKVSGIVDVATYQSLTTKDDLGAPVAKPLVADYDMVFCDECHHGAAPNLERVMRAVCARRVYGLSATPKRQDGLQNIVYMQCGPVRYVVDPKQQAEDQGFGRVLVPRFTRVALPQLSPQSSFNDVVDAICVHDARNRLIVQDVVDAVKEGRIPLVLTRRVAHAEVLARLLEEAGIKVFVLTGGGSARERRNRLERLRGEEGRSFAVVATGSYAGEGFDLPILDTLMLASPYSWEGVITQFVGRLHREDEGKEVVCVHDYVDSSVPMLERMYKRRLRTYARLGYEVQKGEDSEGDGAALVIGKQWPDLLVKDIELAERGVQLSVPYASSKASEILLPALRSAVARGLAVKVLVDEPASSGARERLDAIAQKLEDAGCVVEIARLVSTGIAVIDARIAWYGTLPLLALPKEDDCSLRIVNAEVASDVAEMTRARRT